MALSKKEWLAMQTEWLKEIDPRLRISYSDVRIGNKYAIVQDVPGEGGCGKVPHLLTMFMTRNEWSMMRSTINICGEDAFRKGLQKRMMD